MIDGILKEGIRSYLGRENMLKCWNSNQGLAKGLSTDAILPPHLPKADWLLAQGRWLHRLDTRPKLTNLFDSSVNHISPKNLLSNSSYSFRPIKLSEPSVLGRTPPLVFLLNWPHLAVPFIFESRSSEPYQSTAFQVVTPCYNKTTKKYKPSRFDGLHYIHNDPRPNL
jgi:hypothetical protein